ncbi:hypothetical protein MAR_009570 [Mya arenaria]|uniref:Uncharacterized protein n=1 Tax=Mya arenaria TaxID=6604 RepID=A0ABY7E2H9_MYAAR|nr:hypothetical protein MAR_009570 [Mya arenaria]
MTKTVTLSPVENVSTVTSSPDEPVQPVAIPVNRVSSSTLKQCKVVPQHEHVVGDIQSALGSDTKMIKYHLKLENGDNTFEGKNKSDALMPKIEDTLSSLRPEVPYTVTLEKLLLRVKSDRLLPEDYAPILFMENVS